MMKQNPINYEQVQALKPDLIIMRDSYGQGAYDALSKIAPTITVNVNKEEVDLLSAYALGVPEKGEMRLKAYYDHAKQIRIALADRMNSETTAVLRILNKEIRLYSYLRSDMTSFMAELLNIKPADMVLESELNASNHAISLE
ncbi:MAG: ABC transporter substrate-binding protein [Veillonella caviae]|uniref:ABC transporter substrate-binding protein n=1 Tax=Veillonella caviae TaxID=248316 RepID=UPI002A90D0A2|nr:ABC transporter substrate-binding protein [Veillonella caviae]MDY5481486.1 ABC transporter substrate-binding protein [Veillonella caviae]